MILLALLSFPLRLHLIQTYRGLVSLPASLSRTEIERQFEMQMEELVDDVTMGGHIRMDKRIDRQTGIQIN